MGLLDRFYMLCRDVERVRVGVEKLVQVATYRLPRPEPIELSALKAVREITENHVVKIVYELELKPVEETENNKDVIMRRLETVVDGAVVGAAQDIPRSVTTAIVKFPKNSANCAVRGSYVDDDGNVGDPTDSETFTALDKIKPDAPGKDFATIKAVGEVDEPDDDGTDTPTSP